ncbi:MAG: hypothetical protein ACTSQC_09755 [Candidatus Heimdallarchaeaceae archaeon]
MRKLFKYLLSVCFIILFSFCSTLFLPHAAISEYTIYTRMTEIVVPPELVYRENYPNWTFFEFEYSYEIINPSGKTLYIMSRNTNLVFISGNLSFENEQYAGQVWGPSTIAPAGTNHTINPGITEGTGIINMEVNDTLEALPNGNFTVWMNLDDYEERHNYQNFTSEIAVNGSVIQITHNGANETFIFPEEPTPTPTQTCFFVAATMFGILVFAIIKKQYRLHCSKEHRQF